MGLKSRSHDGISTNGLLENANGFTKVIPINLPAGTYSSGLWLPDIRSDFFFETKHCKKDGGGGGISRFQSETSKHHHFF